ncbi:MAG: SMC family ATPase [Dehalococcoidia bacterium]|nr:SMC family ATPase [Dehalococcoidia bacterium]
MVKPQSWPRTAALYKALRARLANASDWGHTMIPLRLGVKNFLCYGEGLEPLDLERVHVACLCGDNGHGKSALLDAITWALWGEARGTDTRGFSQDNLIHQGRTEMQVDLEFLAGGQRYRVIRKHARARGSRPGTTDLQLMAASDGGYRAITENSVRQTGERIRHLLRMDYTTFTHTAFLRQGRADQFTTSLPSERKRLLAEVLGLEQYEQASQRAREQARSLEQAERGIEGELGVWAQVLQQAPGYQRELAQAQEELDLLLPLLNAAHARVGTLEVSVATLHRQQQELRQVQEALAKALQEQRPLEEQASRQNSRLARLTALVARRDEVVERYAQWLQVRDEEEALVKAQQEVETIAQQRRLLEQTVARERERLASQAATWRDRLEKELTPKIERIPVLEREMAAARSQEAALGLAETEMKQTRQQLEATVTRAQEVTTLQRLLQKEMDQLTAQAGLLSQAGARCPICQTPLGPENRHHLEQEFRHRQDQAHLQHLAHQQERQALESNAQQLRQQLDRRERDVNQRRRNHQATLARTENEIEGARLAAETATSLRPDLLAVEQRLAQQDYAPREQEQLQTLEVLLASLAYDPAHHQAVRQQLRALGEYQGLYVQLQEALSTLEEERQALEVTRQMAQRRAAEAEEAQQRQRTLQEELRDPDRVGEAALAEAHRAREALEGRRQKVDAQVKRCQWELERLEGVSRQREERERHLAALRQQRGLYEELAASFGKNGIQAYVIDEALPELEQEATALLARLTGNRMHLKLETQRQRRSGQGDPIETLDIFISDELGTRSYELFSGGEAFRVNVALRIALSKLLAHRAGAPLPTLFMDEGFGTQDAAGRERLVEVINSIQDDFQKIIVITHIEELKDLFPVRIEVLKTETGSIYWMS